MTQVPSGREMADVAVEAGAIDMAQGVVHTPPPQIFLDILNSKFDERRMHIYASPAGYVKYREALLDILKEEREDLSIDSVMATNGITGGLVSALRSACKPNDQVLLLEPFYPAHSWAIESLHGVPRYVPYGKDFSLDLDAIREALPEVSAFVLGNPANPTGSVIDIEVLKEILSLCEEHDVLLIVDEVYRDFVWEGEYSSLLSVADTLDNLVILRSFSKNLALAGWRVGYAVTSPQRRAEMTHIHDSLYVGAPTAPQFVLAEMLSDYTKEIDVFVKDITELYEENRKKIIGAFRKYGMTPHSNQGAYYMMFEHKRSSDTEAVRELIDKGIAIAPGIPFYRAGTKDTGYIRIHFALSKDDCDRVVEILS